MTNQETKNWTSWLAFKDSLEKDKHSLKLAFLADALGWTMQETSNATLFHNSNNNQTWTN